MAQPLDEPLVHLWETSWRLTRKAEQQLSEIGIIRSDMLVLLALRDGQIVQSLLARKLGMPDSTVSDAIERLVYLGYVERGTSPLDRRYTYVSLTRILGEHVSSMTLQIVQEIAVRVDSALVAEHVKRLAFGNRLRDRYRPKRPSRRPAGRSRLDGVL